MKTTILKTVTVFLLLIVSSISMGLAECREVILLKATLGGIASNLQDLLDGKFSMQNLKNALTGNSYGAAKTFMQFLKAMGIRYLGVIGVGYMIYEYHQCVTS